MTQTTDAALVAGSPATDSRGNFVIPSASELLDRMRHATDRTIGIGRGVRDMRESSRTVPVTVRELKYVEAMVAQAADTIEAQARRIEALEGALRPFAKAGELFGEPLPGGYEEGIYNPAAGPEYGFGAHALRAARAALDPTP